MKQLVLGSRRSKLVTSVLALGLVISLTSPVRAADADCVPAPDLTNARRISSQSLGNGVLASAWRWLPGSDATRANLSSYGTQVSVVSGNLRNIDFGILYAPVPKSQDLRMLNFTSFSALASINGDYMDGNGPWSAMIDEGSMIYSPSSTSGVVGMTVNRVDPTKGYRTSGTLRVGKRVFQVTGMNQPNPSASSVVVYKANYFRDVPPKGDATLVIRNGKVVKIYPEGQAVPKQKGVIVQLRGSQAASAKLVSINNPTRLAVTDPPATETRMAADSVTAFGTVSNQTTTLSFDSINYGYVSQTGATLFDNNFSEVTRAGRVTLRILPDAQGRLVVRNVYRQGYFTKVDQGGLIIQANGTAASTALKFRAGDVVTVSRSYRAQNKSQFVSAAGRGPRILQNGKFIWVCSMHPNDYRPRSAIGWNQDGQVWLITSSRGENANDDGMRMGGSTTDQIGLWLQKLGATDAVLLDGGGSTTMEINQPESGWQRYDLPSSAWYRSLVNAFAIQLKF